MTFSIASWNQDVPFSIDSTSGAITVAEPLDFESDISHYFTVHATDPYGNQSSALLSIHMQAVEEDPQSTGGDGYGGGGYGERAYLPVIGFFTAVGAATDAFARTPSYDAAFVAAGREVFMADVVEAPFKGLAEVLGNVTGLDERRPEGTKTIGEIMERNREDLRKTFPKSEWERKVEDFLRNLFD